MCVSADALAEEDDDVSPSAHSLSLFFCFCFFLSRESLCSKLVVHFPLSLMAKRKNETHEMKMVDVPIGRPPPCHATQQENEDVQYSPFLL